MESIKIGGYDVVFPFKPYPSQKAYMSQVLRCLRERQNGLLESPTGTGKTLSLLCSTLAWLEKTKTYPVLQMMEPEHSYTDDELYDLDARSAKDLRKESSAVRSSLNGKHLPKIFYSSRTHAQLTQACKEMKRSYYHKMSAIVMGGRENLCINKEVMKLETNSAKTNACRAKVKAKRCQYHMQFERKIATTKDFYTTSILDIEDLNKLGTKHKVCPYYATRVLKQKADVVFMPYNYLLDPSSRKALGIQISGNVIIFDEGHNIERICEDSVSGHLNSKSIEYLIKELNKLAIYMQNIDFMDGVDPAVYDALKELSIEKVNLLKDTLVSLQSEIEKAVQRMCGETVYLQELVFDICERVGITFGARKTFINAIEDIKSYLIDTSLVPAQNDFSSFVAHLKIFNDFLLIIFPGHVKDVSSWKEFQQEFVKKYRVFIEKENKEDGGNAENYSEMCIQTRSCFQNKNKRFKNLVTVNSFKSALEKKKPWKLFLWCLSASIALNSLIRQGAHCIIITSGTLAPLHSLQIELEIPFPITLQNRHIIDKTQMGIYIVKSSNSGLTFNNCYVNRQNFEHIQAIGQSILHFCTIIPGGVLLFFASYAVMNNMLKVWRIMDRDWKIFSKLRSTKALIEEPKDKSAFLSAIQEFKQEIDKPDSKGAIFMGVCRGKLSEGLDLADEYCRGVIVVGLPFPASMEPRIIIKRQYLTDMGNPELTANDWYTLQMKRALNQAIGRIVRHRGDYGVVLLLDTRFEQYIGGLSKWIQPNVKVRSYSQAFDAVVKFFQDHSEAE